MKEEGQLGRKAEKEGTQSMKGKKRKEQGT